ncbi:hypothetical protein M0R45_005557 [Rubus argutus]|uniref:Uncharacterized protein n=1 Tax=Rubus argutus TaxID=59490 RepID=A0AAW1YN15_RUBAR
MLILLATSYGEKTRGAASNNSECKMGLKKLLNPWKQLKHFRGIWEKIVVEAFIDGWVQKRLIKLYTDYCYKLSETPNMKLLKKLYDLEVSDDEVTVSEYLSHNLLGNALVQLLCSRFVNALCYLLDWKCLIYPETVLTDACASYLSTILEKCKALCSLSIERCSITSRTIQKIADALSAESVLEQLCIGYNTPISGNAITNLLVKLETLKRFSKLNMNGLKLSKPVVDNLCQLAKTLSLSVLMLGETGIGLDGALLVTESLFHGMKSL